MNKQQFQELPDEEKLKMIDDLLNLVKDYGLVCFTAGWKRVPSTISLWDRQSVDKMIQEFGKEAVRTGFIAARDNGVEKLTYVRNVAQSEYTKTSVKKNISKHEEIKKEENQKAYNFAGDEEWQKLKNKMSIK